MRYAKRRDANHASIVDALRSAGFTVHDFGSAGHNIPDLLAVKPISHRPPFVSWLEVKTASGRLDRGQQAFRAIFEPRGQWYCAIDPEATVMELQKRYLNEAA